MDVCHVITRMILGGAQENTLLTVRGLHEDPDYSVELVTGPAEGPEGELLEDARKHGIEPVLLDSLKREIDPVADLTAFLKLYRFFEDQSFDLVHTHSSKAGILGRWAAELAGVPHVFHTIHGLPFHDYQPRWRYWLFRLLEVATGSVTDQILTVCDRMAEQARQAGIKPRGPFRTVYSGMELDPFLQVGNLGSVEANQAKKGLGFRPDDFVFGKIARLFHLKGHSYLLKAFKTVHDKHPQARLLLVGDGILRDDLERECESLGIRDDVKFAGLVPYQEVPDMLEAMDCLVHTSLREGLARVIPQAQAAGRPVISYDIDGAPEAIDEGKTGFLVEPEAIGPLSDRMERIMEDTELRETMINRAREWVQPRFDWRYMVSEIKAAYETVV